MTGQLLSRAQTGWRDAALILVGLALIIYEAVFYRGPDRWGLYMLYAGMLGLPVFLRADEKRQPAEPPTVPEPPDTTGVS